jgi:hypothetical protein
MNPRLWDFLCDAGQLIGMFVIVGSTGIICIGLAP